MGIVGVISGGVLIGVDVGGASGVGGGEGINIPIMNKITNAYTTYPNSLIIRLSLRIKGNLSFIPISLCTSFCSYKSLYPVLKVQGLYLSTTADDLDYTVITGMS